MPHVTRTRLSRRFAVAPGAYVFALALVLVWGPAARGASVVDPALRFRMLTTAHFTIYFHQGEERTARRLAAIAEDTWRALQVPLGVTLESRTHVVLVDQSEVANGSATPFPYDAIVITAAWPAGSEFIGLTDDWLRLVFTHEYTHILHLDRSKGWARVARAIFGRTPLAFPNLFLPLWQIEGLAVFEESRLDGEGRLHAGEFRAIEETARRDRALEPLDRVNGGLVDWPGGNAQYAYGGAFQEFLANTYGAERLARLADATARSVPYTGTLAFKRIYGKSLGTLWREFEAAPAAPAAAADVDPRSTRLTHHGFTVAGPRFAPGSCRDCPLSIVYALRTPHAFPTLNEISLDGARDRALATRYLGSTAGVSRDIVVFDQDEIRRNVGLYGDLYALDRRTGVVRALTSGSRLTDPDLSPDGTRIVCVRDTNGRRDLVVLDLGAPLRGEASGVFARAAAPARAPEALLSEPDTQFDAPRWSPDGRLIAVARHRLGGESEIVVVDPGTKDVRVIAAAAGVRFVTPAWRPDGGAVVAAADFDGGPFNLYEFGVAAAGPPQQLTQGAGGATWPDVSPDGRLIVYVGYTKDGFDLFTVPYARSARTDGSRAAAATLAEALPERASAPSRGGAPDVDRGGDSPRPNEREPAAATRPYSPWPTLKPTSWTPFFGDSANQVRVGAAVSGYDVLGYHAYLSSLTWLVSAPRGARVPHGGTPDWTFSYAYARWRPVLFASTSRTTSFFTGPPTASGRPADTTEEDTQLETGVQVPFVHARTSHVVLASVLRSNDTYDYADGSLAVHRTALRAGWQTDTAHLFGYSISPERGIALGSTFEGVPRGLDSSASATTVTGDLRLYMSGAGEHHVIAVRAGGGVSNGSAITGRTFLSGGADPLPAPLSFDSRAFALLRGFAPDTFAGTRIASVNVDYRWPLAYIERGHGTFPLFLRAVHAAVFADAANLWTDAFRAGNTKTSVGLEVSGDFVGGYALPFTLALGAAWGHDGAHLVSDDVAVYARVGRAF